MTKKVVAKENHGNTLTKGKTYYVMNEDHDLYFVIDDKKICSGFFRWRFNMNCDCCTSRKCNSCELNIT